MKRFKRIASQPVKPLPLDRRRLRSALAPLLPGLLASLAGLLAAAALLGFALHTAQQRQAERLAETWGQSQAGALQQALQRLSADTEAAASSPALLVALDSGDAERQRAAERSLAHWPGLVDAHLSRRGQAQLDPSRPAPISFAALDLLRRAENGQHPAPEAYRVGERWLLYSVATLRPGPTQPVLGTLLIVTELDRLLDSLPPLPDGVGQLRLVQQFSNAPEQQLLQRGQASGAQPQVPQPLDNPHWTLTFQPDAALAPPPVPLSIAALAALLALAGVLLGLQRVLVEQGRRLRSDAAELERMVRELSSGKVVKAASLGLPPLDVLARRLTGLQRPPSPPGPAPAAALPDPAPIASLEPPRPVERQDNPGEDIESLFQDTDILDILDEEQDLPGLDNKERETAMTAKAPQLPASIFRAYDIRGVVGDSLTPETAYWIGRAIGSESLAQGEPNVSVGRDGRLSGPELVQQLIQGIADCGCSVSDIGMVPTPVLYFATHMLAGKSGVMLTGSHNPPNYNGFKIVIAGDTLANEQIQALRQRIENNDLAEGVGRIEQVEMLERYAGYIRDDIALARPLKVVVDCGNGVAGVIAPQLIEALGCEVVPLFCDVDGNFPNHHPDPGKLENLEDLIAKVAAENADLGLAFDGDGDRVGVVTNKGGVIYPDRLLMLFAKDVVSRNPGADIIFDVKCTRRLTPLISGYGGRPVMWKTGHSLIKKKMKESGALLAGEMSGHIFFKERWFGFDDGIYSAVRLLEILSQDPRDAEQVFAAFPTDPSTPEINIPVTEESKFTIIESLRRDAEWGEANLTTLDGLRVDYPKGWGLVRASNTTPVLVLRFEGTSEEEIRRIQDVFRAQLLNVAPDLTLPF